MPNLTAKFLVDAEPPAKGRTFYWDDKLKGFGLEVAPMHGTTGQLS